MELIKILKYLKVRYMHTTTGKNDFNMLTMHSRVT